MLLSLLLSTHCHFDCSLRQVRMEEALVIAMWLRQHLVSSVAPAAAPNSAMVWLALELVAIPATAASLRPLNQRRAHDFGDISIRWHVCIFCCNPVRDIRVERAKWHTERPSILLFSLEFAHSNRSLD